LGTQTLERPLRESRSAFGSDHVVTMIALLTAAALLSVAPALARHRV
jgi:hypothetical protein